MAGDLYIIPYILNDLTESILGWIQLEPDQYIASFGYMVPWAHEFDVILLQPKEGKQ